MSPRDPKLCFVASLGLPDQHGPEVLPGKDRVRQHGAGGDQATLRQHQLRADRLQHPGREGDGETAQDPHRKPQRHPGHPGSGGILAAPQYV